MTSEHTAAARQSVADGEGRWKARYLAGFGVAIGLLFPVIGLAPPPVGVPFFTVAWVLVVTVMVRYGTRQRVTRRGQGRRMGITFATWAAVYGGALVAGELAFMGNPAYWIPMAVVVAAPFLVGAGWAART